MAAGHGERGQDRGVPRGHEAGLGCWVARGGDPSHSGNPAALGDPQHSGSKDRASLLGRPPCAPPALPACPVARTCSELWRAQAAGGGAEWCMFRCCLRRRAVLLLAHAERALRFPRGLVSARAGHSQYLVSATVPGTPCGGPAPLPGKEQESRASFPASDTHSRAPRTQNRGSLSDSNTRTWVGTPCPLPPAGAEPGGPRPRRRHGSQGFCDTVTASSQDAPSSRAHAVPQGPRGLSAEHRACPAWLGVRSVDTWASPGLPAGFSRCLRR